MQLEKRSIRNTIILFLALIACCPINASVVILNGLTHQIEGQEGNTYRGVIEMQNTATTRQTVKVFLNDYAYKAKGEIYYTEPSGNGRTNAHWIDLNATFIELGPSEKYELFYEVSIPKGLDLNGAYWSVIMVEPVDDLKPTDSEQGVNVKNVIRYAIQIVTTIKRDKSVAVLEFLKAHVKKENGVPFLEVDIENKGDLYHLVSMTVEFYGAQDGEEVGVLKSELLSLLPNNSKRFLIDISTIPPGIYKAVVLADCQDDNVFGLNIDLTIDGG
jgi:hypothetical protein